MKWFVSAASALAAVGYASAQQPAWTQCGGDGWTGGTTCVSGYFCNYLNAWYSQCIPGTGTTTTTTGPSSTSTAPSSTPSCTGPLTKFKYFGVSESCAEFGDGKIPGVLNTDYTWPAPSSIDYFMSKGMNTFRIPFMVERLVPPANGLTGAFDTTYLNSLKTTVQYITGKGGYAAIDPH
ncbi:hypothetical protein FRC06_010608, partial [Ceratobasidium sp. 370]